jgi:hypothetical protein
VSDPVSFDAWAAEEIARLTDLVGVLLTRSGIDYDWPERRSYEPIESVVARHVGASRVVKELDRDERGEIIRIREYREAPANEPDVS